MDRYRRKVSREEARERYLLITKDAWPFFPKPGEGFDLRAGGNTRRAAIEAVRCDCVGGWHEHRRLSVSDDARLVAGQTVEVVHRASAYELRTGRAPGAR